MNKDFFCTNYIQSEDVYTYTLTTRLGRMLNEIEELFGKRDQQWTLLGIEFSEEGPLNWYPYPADSKNVLIRLTNGVANSLREACWELSHEVVHLLSPTGEADATVLEEGMAVWYSKKYVQDEFDFDHPNNNSKYDDAYKKVKHFLDKDPYVIKRIRVEEPSLKKIDSDLLHKYIPNLSHETTIELSKRFIE